jgi:hypothetical protein
LEKEESMIAVRKLTLGLQPENKAFRVSSLAGQIVDTVLEARGKEIPDTYYTQFGETGKADTISLLGEKGCNLLLVDRQNVAFTKSAYPNGHINLDETISEFTKIWSIIQKVVKLKGIRRVGLVAEHRFDAAKNNNIELLKTLTQFPHRNYPANFSLHYESRIPAKPADSLDTVKGAYSNLIYDFYDSALDTTAPEEGKINANLDYQKYYSPSLESRIVEEIEAHFYAFKKELQTFEDELAKLGLRK